VEQQVTHARYKVTTNETLCGKRGLSLDGWNETAEEITCHDCKSKIPRFTLEDLNAAFDPALEQLERSFLESK
jgi:hypothetical protein